MNDKKDYSAVNWGLFGNDLPLRAEYKGGDGKKIAYKHPMIPTEDLAARAMVALNSDFGIDNRDLKWVDGKQQWVEDAIPSGDSWRTNPEAYNKYQNSLRRSRHDSATHPAGSAVYDFLSDPYWSSKMRAAAGHYGKTFEPDLAPLAAAKTQKEAYKSGTDILSIVRELFK
jgi:hypothetical protein